VEEAYNNISLANDLMRSRHSVLHKLTTSKKFEEFESKGYPDPTYLPYVSSVLKRLKLVKASYQCFMNFMRQLPLLLSQALTAKEVLEGWVQSGVQPLNPTTIMEKCSTWETLSNEEQHLVLSEITENGFLYGACTFVHDFGTVYTPACTCLHLSSPVCTCLYPYSLLFTSLHFSSPLFTCLHFSSLLFTPLTGMFLALFEFKYFYLNVIYFLNLQ
jgi:hypothetical protein